MRHSRYVHRVHWLNDRQNKVHIHHGVIAVSVQRAHWLIDRQNKKPHSIISIKHRYFQGLFDQKVQILLIINKFKLKGFLYEQFGYNIYGIYGDNRWGHVVH